MSPKRPLVAIVGRANVGKSTLVNRFLGRRAAIEHPEPGVTRDRQSYDVEWDGVLFTIVDTGGWEPKARGLTAKIRAQAERAAREADLILMITDAQTGPTDDDEAVARGLRGARVPVIVVANKVDSVGWEGDAHRLARLGLGTPVPVSAVHGRGSGDLLDIIVEHLRDAAPRDEVTPADATTAVAIVGRPNVGKSSLFNRLVGDERSIVHDEPGTTRDAVDTLVELGGSRYRFIDTAGMRKRAKEASGPEYYGLVRSLRAIDEADVALHVIDATAGATEQDQRIARQIERAGCAAVVVLNKWDRVEGDVTDAVVAQVRGDLRFMAWAPIVRTSALTKRGVSKIEPTIERVRASWEQRVPTAALNAWLREIADRLVLGSTQRGTPTRIRYVTQADVRPPTFIAFASGSVHDAGIRTLENRLRERFGFDGTPVRVSIRKPRRKERAG